MPADLQPLVYLDHEAGPEVFRFWEIAVQRGYKEFHHFHWPTGARELGENAVVRVTYESTNRVAGLLEFLGLYAYAKVSLASGTVSGVLGAATRDGLDDALAEIRELFPKTVAAEDLVPITFWSYSPNGPRSISRSVSVPTWEHVKPNYGGDVRDHLDRMMVGFRPSHGGQLALWQGVPGTGKTWALRALASEWRDWADFHYITDPDVFFGSRADYMLDVILDASEAPVIDDGDGAHGDGKWRVLLMEDTGEILAADAKERTGQALSRLLNVVDGLIGQGLRILVLVTTNEELKRLHPAVARPGRCAARIEFGELSADEALKWAADRDVTVPHKHATLAELYAAAYGYETAIGETIGFAP